MKQHREITDALKDIGQNQIRQRAASLDELSVFPRQNLEDLHSLGLMGLFAPEEMGGIPCDFKTFSEWVSTLGEYCLPTAIIWGMHCQQMAMLARHGLSQYSAILHDIVRNGHYLGSVTTEIKKGGDLMSAEAPLLYEDEDHVRLTRFAPVVSGGVEADYYLVTMRSGEEAPKTDVRLVLVPRTAEGKIETCGEWKAMGMRPTQSVPMKFDVKLPRNLIFQDPFKTIARQTMIPAGHIAWASGWYGAAKGLVRRFVAQSMKKRGGPSNRLNSDYFLIRLSELRLKLDQMKAMIAQIAQQTDLMDKELTFRENLGRDSYNITYNIELNNLKVACSRLAFQVADDLILLAGMKSGYLKEDEMAIERTFRDLKSAALMFNNELLLTANAKLMLIENSKFSTLRKVV